MQLSDLDAGIDALANPSALSRYVEAGVCGGYTPVLPLSGVSWPAYRSLSDPNHGRSQTPTLYTKASSVFSVSALESIQLCQAVLDAVAGSVWHPRPKSGPIIFIIAWHHEVLGL